MKKNNIANNLNIFKFIYPNSNDKLSDLKGIDLQELLILIDNYYLSLRNNLSFSNNVTFGLELEFEEANVSAIKEELYEKFNFNNWIIKSDGSLTNGAEINSPILRDDIQTWKELKRVCSITSKYAKIEEHSGGHIHVGAHILENNQTLLNFVKMWMIYENIIFRFVYGPYLNARETIIPYAYPVAVPFLLSYKDYFDNKRKGELLKKLTYGKYYAVNFRHVEKIDEFLPNNSIEFRCPNGTLEPVVWQNNVNLFIKLLEYCKSDGIGDIYSSLVSEKNRGGWDFQYYDEIYLDQVLKFCDLIFTNNLDKVYFLRQYFKSLSKTKKETTNGKLVKARNFIKK